MTLPLPRLLIATHNPGKAREIAALLPGLVAHVTTAAELNLPEPEETEATFAGNARLKARAAAQAAQMPALADDSGFCVAALNDAPGVVSARWAGPDKDFGVAMQRVWDGVITSGSADRRAHFICALALVWPDGREIVTEGRIVGTLCWPLRGTHGFGYDPMFIADGHTLTFGEMPPEDKHAISHRARAFAALRAALQS